MQGMIAAAIGGLVFATMQQASDSGNQDLLVRVWGMAAGHAFFQNVYARNLRSDGALLSGIEHPLQLEDVIGVQYGGKKARFRVMHVNDLGLPQRVQAEVRILDGQECPWKELAKTEAPLENADAGSSSNKRQFPRLKIRFPLELRDERGGSAPMQTNSSDISGRGCYVETLVPLPLGTKLTVMFWIDSEKITSAGVVRSSDPGVGMGIEFVGLDSATKERLQEFLQKQVSESGTATAAT
jgi:PilZ domain